MTVSHWQADGSQPVEEVEFLIVGAGLVGCAAAYFASQALPHGTRIVITEARDIALGASGRNAGFMITGLDAYYHHAIEHYGHDVTREVYAMSEQTHAHWRGFIRDSHGGVPMDECGSMLLAESPEEAGELRAAIKAMHADGIRAEFIDGDPLGRGYFAAISQPWDAAVQPVKLAQAVFARSGAELVANNELYALSQTGAVVTAATRRAIYKARYVLLCTNAYSPYIDPYFVGKVIPTRAQVLVTAPLESPVINTCGYSDYGYMYYRMTFDNRLLIGGGRKQNKPLENDTSDDRISEPVQRILDDYLRTRFPDVSAPVERRWAGIMGFTPDGLPLVGTLPDKPSVGFAVGFNGHGLALGAATAERAVDHLLHAIDVGAVKAQRFFNI
jgi:glycine/D-amino acid oxidase-like deaminating enzyme